MREGVKMNMNDDRILILRPIDGEKALSSSGVADPRLFNGENKLHAIKDTQTCMWHVAYDHGMPPPPLRQRFTSFSQLKKFCDKYYETRNIKIVDVID